MRVRTNGGLQNLTSKLLGFALVFSFMANAQAGSVNTDLKFSDVIKEVSFKGDLRIRHESFYKTNQQNTANASSTKYRHRQRFRLRLQGDFKLPNNLAAKIRLASGTGEQVSTNQSFDNLSNQKAIWIDRAYVEWKPSDMAMVTVGKGPLPFWTVYTSDVVWDGDFNPEGAGESIAFFGPFKSKIFVNALQMVVDEDSAGKQDQAYFGQQAGFEVLLFEESKFTFAAALHEWVNERASSFGATNQDGNRETSGVVTNEFRIAEYTTEYKTALMDIPISLQATLVNNQKSKLVPAENGGFQYGAIVGKAGKKNTVEAGHFYKRVETDAVVADVADSDFGEGGTNRRGHISWIAWAPTDFTVLSLKQFLTKPLNKLLDPNNKPVNRWQLDYMVKF